MAESLRCWPDVGNDLFTVPSGMANDPRVVESFRVPLPFFRRFPSSALRPLKLDDLLMDSTDEWTNPEFEWHSGGNFVTEVSTDRWTCDSSISIPYLDNRSASELKIG